MGSDNISVIKTFDNSIIKNIFVGDEPHCIGVLPNGKYFYFANFLNNNVIVVRIEDFSAVATIPVGLRPYDIVISNEEERYMLRIKMAHVYL